MAGHDRSPQHQPREDPSDIWEPAHGPYLCFVAAFLRQAVTDARRTPQSTGSWTENTDGGTAGRQREARAFLLDLNRLAPWVELTGADVDKMQGVLLQAAGLTRAPEVSRLLGGPSVRQQGKSRSAAAPPRPQ